MNVKLVSLTKPLIEGLNNTEDIVAYCARVSNPANQMNTETAPKLIRYLIKHNHWSPMEMVSVCFEIQTSRAIPPKYFAIAAFLFKSLAKDILPPQVLNLLK